jgi:uncharacterized membrane protein
LMKMNSHTFKHFPKDLALVILFTLLCIPFVLIPPLNETPVRIILGLPLVLFLPGYSLIAALFPRKDDLDGIERIALSFGLSIAITPLLGLALNYTPFGIRLSPILIVLSVFTISLSIGAYVRRSMIPEGDRFVVDKPLQGFRGRGAEPHNGAFFKNIEPFKATDTKIDRLLTIILIISIILAISMTVYVIITPKEGEKFTEFYVLDINGTADNYPIKLLAKVLSNYPAFGWINPTESRMSLLNFSLKNLMHNESWESPFIFKATRAGEDQKLEFLLYKNRKKESYRSLHLWVDVT